MEALTQRPEVCIAMTLTSSTCTLSQSEPISRDCDGTNKLRKFLLVIQCGGDAAAHGRHRHAHSAVPEAETAGKV